jgi:hypothetical protein
MLDALSGDTLSEFGFLRLQIDCLLGSIDLPQKPLKAMNVPTW